VNESVLGHKSDVRIIVGDCRQVMAELEPGSVQMCVTSPPYYGLRDYGIGENPIGLESTPEQFIEHMVEVFRGVWRVLRDDGTLWMNLGDSYAGSGKGPTGHNGIGDQEKRQGFVGGSARTGMEGVDWTDTDGTLKKSGMTRVGPVAGYKAKDLMMMPARVALALQADGWYLRSDIIWHKPNPMPESVTDRPTTSHEHIFLLAKSESYYYDADAIREAHSYSDPRPRQSYNGKGWPTSDADRLGQHPAGRNKRSVWTVPTQPYPEAHFATYPEDLIRPCILAGSPRDGVVLDPFGGSGTTGKVARYEGRRAILIELKQEYAELAMSRISKQAERLL